MRRSLALLLALAGGIGVPARAQSGSPSAEVRSDYAAVRGYVLRAAEEMPDSLYGWKPTPPVRTFAQQIAHVADDQYNLCAPARGETRQVAYRQIETTLSTKAELLPALRAAFAYCDAAYDALTDSAGTAMVGSANGRRTRFGMLNWNLWHTWEHYGNVVVYLRMNGLVPPSSQPTRMN